jgi:hypothetical protein
MSEPEVSEAYERGVRQTLSLYAFPCPPLQVFVVREEAGAVDAVSSHDLLQTAREAGRGRGAPPAAHMANLEHYNAALDALFPESLRAGRSPDLARRVYDEMQRYTRESIALYMGRPVDTVDARFAPLGRVRRGDVVHQRAAEHLCLHRRVAGDDSLELGDTLALEFPDLLLEFYERHCADA